MSSYFYLTLDTTAPEIQIYAPKYSIREEPDEIVVKANEKLSSFQEIYAIDSEGKRHDFSFRLSEDKMSYEGLVSFTEFSYGPATLYAKVSDELGNVTEVHTTSLNIINALTRNRLSLETKIKERCTPTREKIRETDTERKIMGVYTKIE